MRFFYGITSTANSVMGDVMRGLNAGKIAEIGKVKTSLSVKAGDVAEN